MIFETLWWSRDDFFYLSNLAKFWKQFMEYRVLMAMRYNFAEEISTYRNFN